MTADAEAIASAVLQEFDRFPGKRKPAVRDNGCHEWVPLSGIVAESKAYSEPHVSKPSLTTELDRKWDFHMPLSWVRS
jgi:hypothetical protein